MTWLSLEQSVEDSQPREGLEIRHGTTVYRIATGTRSVTIAGNLYEPVSAERDAVGAAPVDSSRDVTIRLPASHLFSQRYLSGRAPREITLTIYRAQGADAEQIWTGRIISAKADGVLVTFTATARVAADLQTRRLPIIVSRRCPHVLYGNGCKQSRTGFTVSTTVAFPHALNSTALTVASIGGKPDHWAKHGELLHVPSGERYPIIDQVGTGITLDEQIYGLGLGDAVQIFAGCDRLIATCETKFNNRQNFGGMPELPVGDRFRPEGYNLAQDE